MSGLANENNRRAIAMFLMQHGIAQEETPRTFEHVMGQALAVLNFVPQNVDSYNLVAEQVRQNFLSESAADMLIEIYDRRPVLENEQTNLRFVDTEHRTQTSNRTELSQAFANAAVLHVIKQKLIDSGIEIPNGPAKPGHHR